MLFIADAGGWITSTNRLAEAVRWTSNGWEPDVLTAHVRIHKGATSIVHGHNIVHGRNIVHEHNIVTPPRETRWQTGKTNRILNTKKQPYSPPSNGSAFSH